MKNVIRLRGVVAELRWHTYPAAAVHGYTITRTPQGTVVVSGTVVYQDAFKLAQRPLTFAAPMVVGKPDRQRPVMVTWPIQTFTIRDSGAFTATLSAQQGAHALESVYRSDPRRPIVLTGR
jgi:hypothetical protein